MNLADLTERFNDCAVLRLELASLEGEREKIISENVTIVNLTMDIERKKMEKEFKQMALMKEMRDIGVKSFKTSMANFAVATRYSVQVNPDYAKDALRILKEGGEVEGCSLRVTEYISIKTNG